ncbi:MAG: GNAT family N-acetyltransferase [Ilumatobacteraceae bacterium]
MGTTATGGAVGGLRLRPPRPSDEVAFAAIHVAMADEGHEFGLRYDLAASWSDYLRELADHRCGIDLPAHLVPSTFLVASVDTTIVGRTSIRHRLNDFLAREGGHIGYAVAPSQRRRGYAGEILRQSLIIARAVGVDRVLVTCDDGNVGSAAVIERCGGVFESMVTGREGAPKRRYWID